MAIAVAVCMSVIPAGVPPVAAETAAATPSHQTGLTATPILSLRRVPGWVAQTAAGQRLHQTLAKIIKRPALGKAAQTSCLVASQGRDTLYSFNPLERLLPASNMKLLTAAAVLDRLGAQGRIVTKVAAARPIGGVVHGDLYLIGGGDPLLRTAAYAAALAPGQKLYTSLDALARQVRAEGITEVSGAIVGDASRYDQLLIVPTWQPVYIQEGDAGPLSAMDVNDGFTVADPTAPEAWNPAVQAAATFAGLLRAEGVVVDGQPAAGKTPPGTPVLTQIASPPVGEEVDAMLTVSDDTAAELFTKELGYRATGVGSTATGVAAMRADLAAEGLPVVQLTAADGSGLDRGDKVTCDLIRADLEHVGPTGVVARGLPVAGRTGTLADRMKGTAAAGSLRAKTGTLVDVVALSGFVMPRKGVTAPGSNLGQPIVFSLILNNVTDQTGAALGDQIGVALASYPQLPKLADIEPLP
jgi:D-alanyl-D-alanine carboxypeptidase/D-alanyl-D-alanine-endopeptidase (penicillin-binding protein 4)